MLLSKGDQLLWPSDRRRRITDNGGGGSSRSKIAIEAQP